MQPSQSAPQSSLPIDDPSVASRAAASRAKTPPFSRRSELILLLILSSLALTPLLAPGYFYVTHDGRHSVFYLSMFDASLADGAFWPRWAMHHIQGYGYPTFVIQSPLGFYIGEIFILLGAGVTVAAKYTWAVAFLGSAWGMYALCRHWLHDAGPAPAADAGRQRLARGRLAALVAGLLYVYVPYHLAGMYVRGALNDTLLLAWYPWVLLAFDRLIVGGRAPGWPRRLGLAALLLAVTLMTHTFALISFAPLLVTYVLFRAGNHALQTERSRLGALMVSGLLALAAGSGALLLYANFLLPLLTEGQSLQQQVYATGTYDYRNHFVHIGQFFSPFWGYGYSDDPAGVNDGMGFQVGVMALLLTAVALFQVDQANVHRRGIMAYLLATLAVLLWLMTPWAASLWASFPLLGIIQFPWRLLSLTALVVSALGGLVTVNLLRLSLTSSQATAGALTLALLILYASASYLTTGLDPIEPWREDGRAVFAFEREHPDMIAYTEWVDEPFTTTPMSDDYADPAYREDRGQTSSLTRLAIIEGEGQVLRHDSGGSSGGGRVRMKTPGVVRVHLFYFPGWQARLNGERVPHRVSPPHGVIELDVPAGEHEIDVRMGATPARRAGTAISWIAFVVVAGLIAWPQPQRAH